MERLCIVSTHFFQPHDSLSQKSFLHEEPREPTSFYQKVKKKGGGGGIDEKEVLSKMYSMRQSLKKKKKKLWNPAEHEQPERTTVYVPRRSISPKH